MMKRVFLYVVAVILLIMVGGWLAIGIASEPLPDSSGSTAEAEQLTDKIFAAINKPAYDSLQLIEWSFPRGHHFIWERSSHRVTASWGNNKVVFYPNDLSGEAYVDSQLVDDVNQSEELIQQAWALFANDSFWLVAPYKLRDPGTSRRVVATDRGQALLVTYSSGGVTPGDSYLWILDDEGRPIAWKMWVSILPVKGLEFSWEQSVYHKNAWFAPIHKGPMGIGVDLVIHRVE